MAEAGARAADGGPRSPWIAVLVLVAAADLALLAWLGLGPTRLLLCALFFASAAFVGTLFLARVEHAFSDRFGLLLAGLAIGLPLHAGLCFALFHPGLASALGMETRSAAAQAALAILMLAGAAGFLARRRAIAALPGFSEPGAACLVVALASLVAAASHAGFGNDPELLAHVRDFTGRNAPNSVVAELFRDWDKGPPPERRPEWASRIDSLFHVWHLPRSIEIHGLPEAFRPYRPGDFTQIGLVQHVGVPVQVLGLVDVAEGFHTRGAAAFSKPLALAWFVMLGWSVFLIGRRTLALARGPALAAAAGAFLFAAVIPFPFLFESFRPSHVLTYVATPVHWNLNQLAQGAVGYTGLYLVLQALERPDRRFTLGCALVAASFFYKPSFFFVAAPAIGVASLWLGRGLFRAPVVLGGCVLVAAAVLYFAYPVVFGLEALSSPVALEFLDLHVEHARSSAFPAAWQKLGDAATRALVVVHVLAAWIVALLGLALGARMARGERREQGARASSSATVMLALLLAWGLFSAWCFVEDLDDPHRRSANNYFFGGAAAYTACLPLLVLAITRVPWRPLRILAWTAYALHVASGAVDLAYYSVTGRLT